MGKFLTGLIILAVAVFVFLPEIAMAKEKVAPLIIVAHTTKLTGLQAWWANLYNESPLVFTILTGCVVPIVGVILGLIGDWLMSLTGIDLTKRELVEH